jgi:hypothetical protein
MLIFGVLLKIEVVHLAKEIKVISISDFDQKDGQGG